MAKQKKAKNSLYGYRVQVDNKMPYFGETDPKKKVIKINKRKAKSTHVPGELLDSVLHESLHAKYPRLGERAVQKKTKQATKRLSKKQKSKLYGKINK